LASNVSNPVARVYAAALTEIGRETGTLPSIYDDLQAMHRLFAGDAWFRQFFTSPRIDRKVKWTAVEKAFKGKIGKQVLGLLRVLIEKGREPVLDNIVAQFAAMKDLAENRVHAHVVVARPLPADLTNEILQRLERAYDGKKVQIHERVDPSVLGGVSVRVGDRVIDRTLKTKLAALKKHLLTMQQA
jgi:F-type H+-transporting ATPase subunit delta